MPEIESPICQATTRGRRCRQPAMKGEMFCRHHVNPESREQVYHYDPRILETWPMPEGTDGQIMKGNDETVDRWGFTDADRRNVIQGLLDSKNDQTRKWLDANPDLGPRFIWQYWLERQGYTDPLQAPKAPVRTDDQMLGYLNNILGPGTKGYLSEAQARKLEIDFEQARRVKPGCIRPDDPGISQVRERAKRVLERPAQHPDPQAGAESQSIGSSSDTEATVVQVSVEQPDLLS